MQSNLFEYVTRIIHSMTPMNHYNPPFECTNLNAVSKFIIPKTNPLAPRPAYLTNKSITRSYILFHSYHPTASVPISIITFEPFKIPNNRCCYKFSHSAKNFPRKRPTLSVPSTFVLHARFATASYKFLPLITSRTADLPIISTIAADYLLQ